MIDVPDVDHLGPYLQVDSDIGGAGDLRETNRIIGGRSNQQRDDQQWNDQRDPSADQNWIMYDDRLGELKWLIDKQRLLNN